MTRYSPRNRNERTHDEPKSTARWFDNRKAMTAAPIGFRIAPTSKEPTHER